MSETGIIFSVTTALQVHFPSTPLVRRTIIGPLSHFCKNNFSISHQVSFSYPLMWFIHEIRLVQFYRHGNHTALLNSTWGLFVLWPLFTFEESFSFLSFANVAEKNIQRMSTAKRVLLEAKSTDFAGHLSHKSWKNFSMSVSTDQFISKTGEAWKFCQKSLKSHRLLPSCIISAISYLT